MDNKLETIFKEIIETEKQIEKKRALTVETRNRLLLLSQKEQETETELSRMNTLLEVQVARKIEQELNLIELNCHQAAIEMCQCEFNDEVESLKQKLATYQDSMVVTIKGFYDHVSQFMELHQLSAPQIRKKSSQNYVDKLATLTSVEQHLTKEIAQLEQQQSADAYKVELTALKGTLAGLEQAMQAQKLTIAALDKELMFAKMPQEEYNRLQKELDATNASYSTQQTLCDNLRSQLGWISNK